MEALDGGEVIADDVDFNCGDEDSCSMQSASHSASSDSINFEGISDVDANYDADENHVHQVHDKGDDHDYDDDEDGSHCGYDDDQ